MRAHRPELVAAASMLWSHTGFPERSTRDGEGVRPATHFAAAVNANPKS